jgi:hypothetical protein
MLIDQPVIGEPAEVSVADQERSPSGRMPMNSPWWALTLTMALTRSLPAAISTVVNRRSGNADQHRHQLLGTRPASGELGRERRVVVRPVSGDQLVRGVDIVPLIAWS